MKQSKILLLAILCLVPGHFAQGQSVVSSQERFKEEKLPGRDVSQDRLNRGIPLRDYREKPPKPPKGSKPVESNEPLKAEKEDKEKLPTWKLEWFRNTMIGLALLLALFILWKVFGSTIRLKSQRGSGEDWGDETTGNEVRSDADYDSLALEAEKNGDYRQALRFRFLGLLQSLHRNAWIQLAKDKTNRTYLNEATGIKQHPEISSLTRAFEKAWYGHHIPPVEAYRDSKQRFVQVLQQMERKVF